MTTLGAQVTLFPHQKKAVAELGNGKVLWGDVGTGKTLTAMAYYAANEAPKDVYVITTAKKRDSLDWQADAVKYSVSTHEGVGIAKLTVDSWNNIAKYTEVKDAFFIFDEQRLVGTGAWVKSFYKIAKANRWILLTATPGDTWLDYAPIFIANGWYKNITEFRREHVVYSYAKRFPKVERYIAVNRLVRQRNAVLVEMPYLRTTKRHVVDVDVDYDRDLFDKAVKKRWHPYEERPLRDVAELFLVMRKVVNSDESRAETVKRLLKKHPKLIVFYNFDYELEALRSLGTELSETGLDQSRSGSNGTSTPTNQQTLSSQNSAPYGNPTPFVGDSKMQTAARSGSPKTEPSSTSPTAEEQPWTHQSTIDSCVESQDLESQQSTGLASTTSESTDGHTRSSELSQSFATAEWNGHKHEAIPTTDSWLYFVQYTAGAEGWNCTDTDAMVFYSLNYSFKISHQSMGRIDRLNTSFKDLYYYRLVSKSLIDKAILGSLKDKRNFNEAAYLGNTRLDFPGNR